MPEIEHAWEQTHEGRFKADGMNEKMEMNKAMPRNYGTVIAAKASMLRFNVGASSQRTVYDDVHKPISNSHTLENALHTLQRYALGILIVTFPKLQAVAFP